MKSEGGGEVNSVLLAREMGEVVRVLLAREEVMLTGCYLQGRKGS